ncbi:MAG: BatD family protein [Weeksellaceae bacterium]
MPTNLFTYCLLMWSVMASAQVSFKTVVDKPQVKVGERVQVSFVITSSENVEISEVKLPNFNGFQVLGRNSGSQVSYTNGELSRQYIESVVICTQKPGKYTFGVAEVKIDGKVYSSNPVTITVSKQKEKSNASAGLNGAIQMRLELSKDEVYPNQPIIADVKLYAKSYDLLRRRSDIEVPGISGFQVEKISANQERNFQQEVINGQVYVSEEIAQFQLIPTQTGELVIPAFKIRLAIPLDFFEEKIVLLKTEPENILVKNLPHPAPKDFDGAVGNFKLNALLDDTKFKVNESITYEIEIIGEGNLSAIDLPALSLSPDLEVYPPKQRQAFKKTLQGEKGKIAFTYVIVPQYGGNYTIPSKSFTYFDPNKGEYKTISTEAYTIEVDGKTRQEIASSEDSLELHSENDTVSSNLVQSNVDNLNRQVSKYIKIPDLPKFDDSSGNDKGWLWWLLLPLLAIFIWFVWKKSKTVKNKNMLKSKQTEELKLYKKQIQSDLKSKLEKLEIAKNHQDFNAFTSYSSEILNQIVAVFDDNVERKIYTQSQASEILSLHVSDTFISTWEKLHRQNQLMRYAGTVSGESLVDIYSQYQVLVNDSLNKA